MAGKRTWSGEELAAIDKLIHSQEIIDGSHVVKLALQLERSNAAVANQIYSRGGRIANGHIWKNTPQKSGTIAQAYNNIMSANGVALNGTPVVPKARHQMAQLQATRSASRAAVAPQNKARPSLFPNEFSDILIWLLLLVIFGYIVFRARGVDMLDWVDRLSVSTVKSGGQKLIHLMMA